VGSGERVKHWLSQALIKNTRPDSNSRPAMQISNPLLSHQTPLGLLTKPLPQKTLHCDVYTIHLPAPSQDANVWELCIEVKGFNQILH
jgi:hypothetical protein